MPHPQRLTLGRHPSLPLLLAQAPSPTMTITPMVNWGFSLIYMLNQPNQETVRFNPPQNFFPVQGCISITDVVG